MAKTKAKKQVKGAALPAGFTAVAVGGSFGVTHDFRTHPVCMGKVLGVDTVNFKDSDGKKKKSRVMRVQVGNESRSVWESSQLSEVFNVAKRGKEIYIKFHGKKKIKGGRSVNLFTAGIK